VVETLLREEIPRGWSMEDGCRLSWTAPQGVRGDHSAIEPTQQARTQNPTRRLPRRNLRGGSDPPREETALLWARIEHKQTSCGLCGMDVSHLLCYQRLTRGLCLFMKNSG